VKAQDIWRSVLWNRINTNAPAIKMPPLARNLVDTNAVQVFTDWINSLPGTPALAPASITPNGGTFTTSVAVTLQSPDPTAAIYYTLDGSLPSTSSLLYSGTFNLLSNATVTASAFRTNYVNSANVKAAFLIQPLYFTSQAFTNGEPLSRDRQQLRAGSLNESNPLDPAGHQRRRHEPVRHVRYQRDELPTPLLSSPPAVGAPTCSRLWTWRDGLGFSSGKPIINRRSVPTENPSL
jgi:hypothetical protein